MNQIFGAMERLMMACLVLVFVGGLVACGPAVTEPPDDKVPSDGDKAPSAAVEAFINKWVGHEDPQQGLASVALGVIENYELKIHKTYGYAHAQAPKRAATNKSIYLLASCSKPLVGLAAAILQEKLGDKLDMDADINDYLEWDKVRHTDFPDEPVTLNQLLLHTAGLKGNVDFDPKYDTQFPSPDPEDSAMEEALKAQVSSGNAWQEGSKPGTKELYSNVGVALAALVIEKAAQQHGELTSDENFRTFCNREIFEPAGMSDTRWYFKELDKEQQGRVVSPHKAGLAPTPHFGFVDWPSGMLRSTVADMSKLFIRIMQDMQPDSQDPVFPKTALDLFHGIVTNKPLLIGKEQEGAVLSFDYTGEIPGAASTYFSYRSDGSGWIYLINTQLPKATSEQFMDTLNGLLKKEIGLEE